MKKNIKTKTHNLYKIVFLFVVFLGIGYAFLEANLNINGDVTVEAPELNVYVQSTSVTSGSTTGTPTIIGNDKKEVDFTTALTNDGNSFFEETTTLVNKGSKKAYLLGIDVKAYDSSNNEITLAAPYEYSVTKGDGSSLVPAEELAISGTTSYKFKFNYISGTDMTTVTDYPTYTFKITYNYVLESFANDSWSTIATNVQDGKACNYAIGSTRTLSIDEDGDGTNENYTLRLVNCSTPTECNNSNFSQSACGFVVEFKDTLITNRMMNSSGNTVGGWPNSDLHSYFNTGANSFYSKLPSDLRNVIIDTKTISGHTYSNEDNFESIDKIYLYSQAEIYGPTDYRSSQDTAVDFTRQVDYYVGTTNSDKIKYTVGTNTGVRWWLRSVQTSGGHFDEVMYDTNWPGEFSHDYPATNKGIVPVFRIGINE